MRTNALRRPVAAGLVFAALSSLLLRSPVAAAEEEVLRDSWQVVRMGEPRVGWEHTRVRRLPGGEIETTAESRVVISRMGTDLEMSGSSTTVEREDGTLVSMRSSQKQSAVETLRQIAFEDGKAKIATTVLGQTRESEVPLPEGVVGPWQFDRTPRDAGYPEGRTFSLKQFVPDYGGVVELETTVVTREGGAAPAKPSRVKLRTAFPALGMTTTTWVEADGSPIEATVSVMGMEFRSARATKEEALGEETRTGPAPDFFTPTLVVSKVLVPHARTLETARVRVRPKGPETVLPGAAEERQTVEAREPDGSIVLRLRRVVPPDGTTSKRPLQSPPSDLAPYLAASSDVQSDDPLLQSTAAEAVAGETDAWKAAQAIERWVAENLTQKNLSVGSASALEVCRDRAGDCTEHAVLVAGLCRAAGIPARVAIGLEYLAGIWGGHAWNEVWVAGRWYALDATNGYGFVDPLHITLATSALAEGSLGKEFLGLAKVIGSIDVEILETTRKGRTYRPTAPDAVRVSGGGYVNRLFDLSFTAPTGYSVTPVVPAGLENRLAVVSAGSDGKREIVVHVDDLPRGLDLEEAFGRAAASGATVERIEVDGRPGVMRRRDGKQAAAVAIEESLIRFETDDAADEAVRKAFADLLASVDLDPAKN
jgi:hypothetical protein